MAAQYMGPQRARLPVKTDTAAMAANGLCLPTEPLLIYPAVPPPVALGPPVYTVPMVRIHLFLDLHTNFAGFFSENRHVLALFSMCRVCAECAV